MMEWVLRSPQFHSTFSNLGCVHADGYHVNEKCNAALECILHNILHEDKYLRTYRKSIGFGQNIRKDLIPLLIHTKDDKTIELLTRIFVNLTTPTECLFSVEVIAKSDFGRHTLFEINSLLTSTKNAFTDYRATRVVIDFLKKNVGSDQKAKLLPEQCSNINDSLLLLRNILHIPENNNIQPPNITGSSHKVQNQIIWNIFSQSIDKVLIKLMVIPEAFNWGVTMVQFIALLYKDQHFVTLHKLLNVWLEASLSESSEDNESNTSLKDGGGSEDSSSMPTSPSTSEAKSSDEPDSVNNEWAASSDNNIGQCVSQSFAPQDQVNDEENYSSAKHNVDDSMKFDKDTTASCTSGIQTEQSDPSQAKDKGVKKIFSDNSDCGYATQIGNQESLSTSSNEDDVPTKKPVHQKPHNLKQKPNNKIRCGNTLQDRKRKKIVKRGKSNIINVKGLTHKTPTDNDISNVLKEFTVDFLLKGYNSLVHMLHKEILTNSQFDIDTSHFFWLVTYFLKFAAQIELDLDRVSSVLSFEIVSYLTAEGVNLCEQFELAIKLDGNDLAPTIRRLHLVVTSIREFVQAIEVYKKQTHMNNNDKETLMKLQIKMSETEELRSLLVLLLRHFDPKYHTKQYLQDLIVTNHILLKFLDNVMKLPEYNGSVSMVDHLRQFATPKVMHQYGLLLEDYYSNGVFVNDCIFTIMHHVSGDLECLKTLFQPKILKAFISIWKSEFELCDDWSDLVEYAINTFIRKPHSLERFENFHLDCESNEGVDITLAPKNVDVTPAHQSQESNQTDCKRKTIKSGTTNTLKKRWTEDAVSSLSWMYLQCNMKPDVIGEIIKLLKDDGNDLSRESIIRQLFKQNVINKSKFEELMSDRKTNTLQKDKRDEEISKLCQQIAQDGNSKFLDWVQKVLLETCHAKIYLEKKKNEESVIDDSKLLHFEVFKKKEDILPVLSPVSYHALVLGQSVPLVPWNCQQASICKDLKFLQLLHKLGFYMPVDSGKLFIRVPHFWTADFLYKIAGKISRIDTTKLKFSVNQFAQTSAAKPGQEGLIYSEMHRDFPMEPDNYQVHKHKHLATMVNFTPKPGPECFYNTDADEINNHNWLKVVQKSQVINLSLNLSSLQSIPEPSITVMMSGDDLDKHEETSKLLPINEDAVLDSQFCNESHCDTASVASDLMCMYVSDEDEKPEDEARAVSAPPHSLSALHGKRPRLTLSPF